MAVSANWAAASFVGGFCYVTATCVRLYDYSRSRGITPPGFFRGFPSPAAAWMVTASVLCFPYPWNFTVMLGAAILMCLFSVKWQHFGSILPTLSVVELVAAMLLGLLPAFTLTPLGFLAGPIAVYALSPLWRKPKPGDGSPLEAVQGNL